MGLQHQEENDYLCKDKLNQMKLEEKELKSLTSKKITGGKTLRRKPGKKNKSIKLTFLHFINNLV